jgi:hypothetical protein
MSLFSLEICECPAELYSLFCPFDDESAAVAHHRLSSCDRLHCWSLQFLCYFLGRKHTGLEL